MQAKLANKDFYKVSIGEIRLQLPKLQESDKETLKLRTVKELQENQEDIDKVL